MAAPTAAGVPDRRGRLSDWECVSALVRLAPAGVPNSSVILNYPVLRYFTAAPMLGCE